MKFGLDEYSAPKVLEKNQIVNSIHVLVWKVIYRDRSVDVFIPLYKDIS